MGASAIPKSRTALEADALKSALRPLLRFAHVDGYHGRCVACHTHCHTSKREELTARVVENRQRPRGDVKVGPVQRPRLARSSCAAQISLHRPVRPVLMKSPPTGIGCMDQQRSAAFASVAACSARARWATNSNRQTAGRRRNASAWRADVNNCLSKRAPGY